MNAALEAIKQTWADKTAAKERAFAAMQAAKLDDQNRFLAANPTWTELANPSEPNARVTKWQAATSEQRAAVLTPWLEANGYSALWDEWEKEGIRGNEGRLAEEMQSLCDAYVAAHPEQFDPAQVSFTNLSKDEVVEALTVFRSAGFEEEQWKLEVWQWHHWERDNIGGQVQTRIRIVGGA